MEGGTVPPDEEGKKMGHMIEFPANCSVAVVGMDGDALSFHRTPEAAQAEVDRENRAFCRKGYDRGGAWLPRTIIDARDLTIPRSPRGRREIYIERSGQHSTCWRIAD